MTPNKATILLNRLVVFKADFRVYDQAFHSGVNIIRSKGNTCGKTTLMDFIYFVLGGDVTEWSPEAGSCDYIFAEFEFNSLKLTLKRKITVNKRPDIGFYFGGLEESLKDLPKWNDFPNARSESKKSYSQLIFELLGFPEDKTTDSGNITIFELLRLVYCDQLTAVDEIFMKREFDSAAVRRAIGEFLLGLDDFDLHTLRSGLRKMESEHAESKSKHRAALSFLAEADMPTSVLELKRLVEDKESESREIKALIEDLENSEKLPNDYSKIEVDEGFDKGCSATANKKQPLGHKTRAQQVQIVDIDDSEMSIPSHQEEQAALEATAKFGFETVCSALAIKKQAQGIAIQAKQELIRDIEDSEIFIASIQERLTAFKEARIAHDSLGAIDFDLCPACLAKVVPEDCENKCRLCKEDLKISKEASPIFRVQFELEAQLRESEKLLNLKKIELEKLGFEIDGIRTAISSLEDDLHCFEITPSPIQASLKSAYKKLGRINEEFKKLQERGKLISALEQMEDRLIELTGQIEKSKNHILRLEKGREKRLESIEARLSSMVVGLLKRDLPGEENFHAAKKFEFSFEKDKMRVNDQKRFSASSLCFLKSVFYFAILKLSLEDSNVRYPRFVLLDNIEDKGATPDRVQNMHKMLIEDLEDKDCQVIFTTSLLAEELEGSKYCVGPRYTASNKSLNFPAPPDDNWEDLFG